MVVGTYHTNKSNCCKRAHLQVRNAVVHEEKPGWQADETHVATSVLKECYGHPFGGLRALSPLRFLRWLLWSFAWMGSVLASLLSRKARIVRMAKYCYVGRCEYHNVDIEGAHNHDSHISRYPTFEVNFYTLISVDHYNHIAFSSSKSSRDGLWN